MRLTIKTKSRRSRPARWALALLTFVGVGSTALAAPIEVKNHSFEAAGLDAGGWTNDLTDWVGQAGASNGGAFQEHITGFASEGTHHIGMQDEYFVYQRTGVSVQPNTTYTLIVGVGNRNAAFSPEGALAVIGLTTLEEGATLEVATAAAQVAADASLSATVITVDSFPIGESTFADAVLTFTTGAEVPAGNVTIFLGDDVSAGRAHFDNVRLYAHPGFIPAEGNTAGPAGLVGRYWSLAPKATDPTSGNLMHRAEGNPAVDADNSRAGYADSVFQTEPSGTFVSMDPNYQGGNDLTPIVEWLGSDGASYEGDTSETAILGDGVINFTGYLWIEEPGDRDFLTNSDDGSVVYINNELVVQHDNGHGANNADAVAAGDFPDQIATVNFPEAGYYPVDIRYFNGDWTDDAGAHGGANLATAGFDTVVQSVSSGGAGDPGTIAEIAGEAGFNTLVAALTAAGLADTFSDPAAGPFTVFAPTDEAFAALPDGVLDAVLADPEGLLTEILTYHVVSGAVLAETVVTLTSATTLNGKDVTIEIVDGGVVLNGTVNVTMTDIIASNGVIHVIDAVLLPPADADPATLAEGLIAYYPFDGTLDDVIGGSNGAAVGADPIEFTDDAAFGQGIDLNGVDQYVDTQEVSKFDFADGTGFTVSTWFRVDAFTKNWQALIASGEGSDWRVHRQAGQDNFAPVGGNGDIGQNSVGVNDGELHHVVLVNDPDPDNGGISFYMDGVLIEKGAGGTPEGNDVTVKIGENPEGLGRTWDGLIDDVAIWNRPLTGGEVALLGSGPSLGELLPSSAPELIACWDFQDAAANPTATDVIGGNVGELVGPAGFSAYGEGVSGQAGDVALDFGGEGGAISVDGAFLNDAMAGDSVSVMFWQKLRNVTNQTTFKMVSPSSSGGERGWSVHTPWSNEIIYFDTAGCCDAATQRINADNAGFSWDEWHHFTFVKDGNSKQIWIDGAPFHVAENTSPLPSDITELWIGSGSGAVESVDGWLDEFRIFKGAVTEADIANYMAFKSIPAPLERGPELYSQSFDADDGSTDLGDGSIISSNDGTNQVQGGALRMTEVNVGGSAASFTLPAFDGSKGWVATFDFVLDHTDGGNTPADGFSFNYGEVQPADNYGAPAEEGYGPDVQHVSFQVDSWNWNDEAQDAGLAIGVSGTGAAYLPAKGDAANFKPGERSEGSVVMSWDPAKGASFSTSGLTTNASFMNIPTAGFVANPAYGFSIVARTGGHTETLIIDNLKITALAPDPLDGALVLHYDFETGSGDTVINLAGGAGGGVEVANSVTGWAGTDEQGANGWTYGYRDLAVDAPVDYDPTADFIAFPADWWTGTAWDEPNADGDSIPWTTVAAEASHPNGPNSGGLHHWAIRRWVSDTDGLVNIEYSVAKQNVGGGNGVTAAVHVNGVRIDSAVIEGTDGVGVTQSVQATLAVGDVVDLVHSPVGTDGTDNDGSDGSILTMAITTLGGGVNGTFVSTGDSPWGTSTGSTSIGGPGVGVFDSDNNAESTYVDTNLNPEAMGIMNAPYTMMVRARQDAIGAGGDAMIFGQDAGDTGEVLHNGARNSDLYMAHWGDDINSSADAVVSPPAQVDLGAWHHFAYVYDGGEAGTLSLYRDGVLVAQGERGGLRKSNTNVLIGTTRPDQDRDFIGLLDDVRIYAAAATAEQVFEAYCTSLVEDCDGDGMNDAAEIAAFGDLSRDGTRDLDGDRLNDASELNLGTDPTNRDSDGDGLWDGEEVFAVGSNPNDADSDGDGLSDGEEFNTVKTDPNDEDSDNDGRLDGDELTNGPLLNVIDFETDPGLEIINIGEGGPEVRAEGGNPGGYLSLTDAINGAKASIIFPDTTGGANIAGFNFKVDARIGGGTERPADGMSISLVRPSDPLLADPRGDGFAGTLDIGATEENLPEEGATTGVSVGFDAWESGGDDIVGFSVRVDGEMIAQIPAGTLNGSLSDPLSLQTGPRAEGADNLANLGWAPFEINLDPDGTLDVIWKGSILVDNVQTSWTPSPGQLVFAARTGGANQAHHFDNLAFRVIPEGSVDPNQFNAGDNLLVHYDFNAGGGAAAGPLDIIFVSFHETDAASAAAAAADPPITEASDKGYTDLLTANGHNVTRWLTRDDPTADDAAALNAADLIIISRAVSSGNYQQEAEFWNTMITTPVMNLGGYTYRSSRLNWTDGTTMVDSDGPVTLDVADPSHPIFAGVDVSQPYAVLIEGERGVSFNTDNVVGGTVLATAADTAVAGGAAIFEFAAGATVNNGNVLAGPRLAFLTGSRELDRTSETAGFYDLTASGEAMFLNAVAYIGGSSGGSDPLAVANNGSAGPGALVAPEGVTLADITSTALGDPTQVWNAAGSIPTMNNTNDGADVLDATWRALIDFNAKPDGGAENIFETGAGTIGLSFVYEAPSTLWMRSTGLGGQALATTSYQLSQEEIDAGELEVIWTHDSNPDGPETLSIFINGALKSSGSLEKGNDWSGGDGGNVLVASTNLAGSGSNGTLPGNAGDFVSGTANLDQGVQFFRDTLFISGVLRLDGTNGEGGTYVSTLLSADALNINGPNANYTALARIQPASVEGDNMLFGQLEGNTLHNGIRGNQLHFGHWGSDSNSGETTVSPGVWYDVAYRYSRGVQSIFLNGELVGKSIQTRGLENAGTVTVGTSRNDGAFEGLIDDIKIYGVGLSQDAIRNAQGLGSPAASSLLVSYQFEDGITTTIRNDGNQGAPNGHLNSVDVIGAFAMGSPSASGPGVMAFSAAGNADATYIDTNITAAAAGVNGAATYTQMAWILPTRATNGDQMIFGQPTSPALHNGIRDQRLHIGHWGNDLGSAASPVAFNQWQHVAFSYDGVTQRIYLNGQETESGERGGLAKPDENIIIGTTVLTDDRDYEGWLDDVRIYNTTLGGSDISQIAGLVDSDGDGLLDPFERAFFGDLAMDGSGDIDMDGLTNEQEETLGLDPTVGDAQFSDADGDGWTLGDEEDFGTNPENAASFPEVFVGGGQWEVRIIETDAAFADVNDAVAVLNGESGNIIADNTTMHDFINFGNAGGGAGSVGNDTAWPHEEAAGADLNNFAMHAVGTIEVKETGNYSLNFPTDDGMRYFVDGEMVDEFVGTRGAPGVDATTIRLTKGQHTVELVQFENGGGDNAEFSGAVVTENSLNGLGGGKYLLIPAAAPAAPDSSSLANGLIAYYPFDGNLDDVIGGSNGVGVGTDPNIEFTGDAAFGQGIDLNGVDQYVDTQEVSKFDFADGTGFTVSAWFRVDAFTKNWQALIASGEGSDWRVHRQGGQDNFAPVGGNGDIGQNSVGVNDGQLHHVVLVNDPDPDNGGVSFFMDGVLIEKGAPGTPEGNDVTVKIGENPEGLGRTWDGLIDDVAIWDRPLTESEVGIVNSSGLPVGELIKSTGPPAGLLAYWDFNGSGDPVDLVNGTVAVLTDGAAYGEGPGGAGDGAVDFGTTSEGQTLVVDPSILEPIGDSDAFTVSFWQNLRAVVSSSAFWVDSVAPGDRALQAHAPWSNGQVYLDTAGCCDAATQRINAPVDTPLDTWQHFAFVKDGPNKTVYVDGVEAFGGVNTAPIPAEFLSFNIGSANAGGNSMQGLMDEFSIWSVALSVADIQALAAGGKAYVPSAGPAPVYSQNFDAADGSIDLGDGSIISSNDGTNQIQGGALRMTEVNVGGSAASFTLPAFDASGGWTATFDFVIDHTDGGNTPADGFSFNYGEVQPADNYGAPAEEGYGPDVQHVSFQVDSWNWNDEAQDAGLAIGVNGAGAAYLPAKGDAANFKPGERSAGSVVMSWDPANGASFSTSGLTTNASFENIATPDFSADAAYGFSFVARTGGHTETVIIDNLNVVLHSGGGDEAIAGRIGYWPEAVTSTGADHVDLGVLPQIDVDTDFTWSFWVNPAETDNNTIVLGNRYMPDGTDFAPREFIKFTPRGFEWHFNGGPENVVTPETMLEVGVWSHNLVVKSGSTLTYYRDGVAIASGEITGAPANPQPLYLGGQPGADGATAEGFSGEFMEVAIFDRALSHEEVQSLAGVSGGPAPIAHWPLDALVDGTTPDVVGGRDMTAVNLTADDVVPGAAGNAFSFDNARMTLLEYIATDDGPLPVNNSSAAFSIGLWSKVNGTGQNDLRLFSEASTTDNTPLFNIGTNNTGADGSLDLYVRGGGNDTVGHIYTTGTPFDDTWHHVLFVKDGTSAVVYIDGVADPLEIALGENLIPSDTVSIGGIRRAAASHWVTGLIDEVKIWDVALTADQAAAEAGVAAQRTGAPALADRDRDGVSDLAEGIAGTDANNRGDFFRIGAVTPQADGVAISFDGVEGRVYEIEFSKDLTPGSWQTVGSQYAEQTSTVEFIDNRTQEQQGYYRARVVQD